MPQLSQRWKYCHLESNRNADPMQMFMSILFCIKTKLYEYQHISMH